MKIPRAALVALAVLPAAVVFAAPRDAAACGSAVRLEVKPQQKPTPVQEIARAEKALESGSAITAAQAVLGSFPRIRSATAGNDGLETRALRVFALALVRSNGTADEKRAGVPTSNEWTTAANLDWAVQALREIDQKRPNDPALRADLGEALAKTAAGEGEALTILAGLDKKDLTLRVRGARAPPREERRQGRRGGGGEALRGDVEDAGRVPPRGEAEGAGPRRRGEGLSAKPDTTSA